MRAALISIPLRYWALRPLARSLPTLDRREIEVVQMARLVQPERRKWMPPGSIAMPEYMPQCTSDLAQELAAHTPASLRIHKSSLQKSIPAALCEGDPCDTTEARGSLSAQRFRCHR